MIKLIFSALVFLFAVSQSAKANPTCSIEFARVTNVLGVVAGTTQSDDGKPVFITLENGGLTYTTVADTKGNWATTFRYFSSHINVAVWQEGATPVECQDNFGLKKKNFK